MENSLYHLVQILLTKNKFSFNLNELILQIESHPSYPSLHAITGVLDHFEIENIALDIPQNKEVYGLLPKYFIAQIKTVEKEELVFVDRKNDFVTLTYSDRKRKKVVKNDFLEQWSGIVVVVEKDELATNSITQKKQFYKLIPILLVAISFIFSLYKFASFSLLSFLQISLSLAGTYIGYLLVKHELGINSSMVEKLCTSFEKTNCDAVLNSKAASVFGWFKLSDIVFVYFSSLSIIWIMSFFLHISPNLLSVLSILSVPIVIFSLYYQSFVVKKWCPLCLATASILIIQALVFYPFYSIAFQFNISDFIPIAVSLSLVILSYSSIKPLVNENLDLSKSKIEFYRFKRKFSLFQTLYNQKSFLDTSIQNVQEITFGNKSADIEIVVITNPLCSYCKATHNAIEKLLNTNKKEVKITIRFNINISDVESIPYKIATVLLNLYQKDVVLYREAMYQIYTENVNILKWIDSYNAYTNPTQHTILEAEKQWCIDKSVSFTPAVYLNNKEFPREYELNDLSLFIDDINEKIIKTQPIIL